MLKGNSATANYYKKNVWRCYKKHAVSQEVNNGYLVAYMPIWTISTISQYVKLHIYTTCSISSSYSMAPLMKLDYLAGINVGEELLARLDRALAVSFSLSSFSAW